jgi:flagellar protein FlaG
MNSEINNNLPLSYVMPVKAETGLQNASSGDVSNNQPANGQSVTPGQNQSNQPPSLESVKNATANSSPLFQAAKLSVEYNVDSATNEVVMKVVDAQGQVVRQIPSAEMLDFVQRLQDWENKQKGAVIQTSA